MGDAGAGVDEVVMEETAPTDVLIMVATVVRTRTLVGAAMTRFEDTLKQTTPGGGEDVPAADIQRRATLSRGE